MDMITDTHHDDDDDDDDDDDEQRSTDLMQPWTLV